MRIGIDARFIGPQGTGLGVYTQNLVENLQKIDKKNDYFIFLKQDNWSYLKLTSFNFTKVLADIPWYSLAEQTKMSALLKSKNLNLVHFPHFNVPILYRKKFVVTIHDLIHKHSPHTITSTKNSLIFRLKRFGFNKVLNHALNNSSKIIAPSNYVKEDIMKSFKIDPQKISVTHEAAEVEYFASNRSTINDKRLTILYVGNAYPHKNLEKLLEAIAFLKNNFKFQISNFKLLIVCPRDVFSKRLEHLIKEKNLQNRVDLLGYKKAKDLASLFRKSSAYVCPSLWEGFGIPGLNAMASQIPLICSNIPTFKEIYGDAAIYFNPNDPVDIAQKIKHVLTSKKTRLGLVERGKKQVKNYSWQKMAKQTLRIYQAS